MQLIISKQSLRLRPALVPIGQYPLLRIHSSSSPNKPLAAATAAAAANETQSPSLPPPPPPQPAMVCPVNKGGTGAPGANMSSVKPFRDMPGPSPMPFIWNIWRYFPFIGQYQLEKMDQNGRYNLSKYGKIVREEISSMHRIVHLFDPKHMESMFAQEDRYPCRRSHRALLKYRSDRPDIYKSGGIFPENGAEWARLRDLFKKHFLLARNVNAYDAVLDSISGDLVSYIRATRDVASLEVVDFQQDMYRWALESICAVMLDTRMGCLGLDLSEQSDPSRLIHAAHQTIHAVMKTELYNSWETRDTKDYLQLVEGQDVMAEICGKHLQRRIREIESGQAEDSNSLLTQFVQNPDINRKDLFAMILDSVLAGIDTTSITTSFALYFLAKYPYYQDMLREEIRSVIGATGDAQIKAEHLASMPVLKAVVKETLRLRPVSIGVGRLTTCPVEIGGYRIPSDTMIITQNQVSCQLEEYFPEAHRFKPERWLVDRSSSVAKSGGRSQQNRYLWLPFGHGTRMCLGRRIAELEIYIVLCKIVANFRVEYHHEDIGVKTMLINIPDKQMKYRFVDLE